MKHALVTGVAGFIGSTLAERLCADGVAVTGVECFTDYYPRWRKEQNLEQLRTFAGFRLVEADLVVAEMAALLAGRADGRATTDKSIDCVFHLAGQPGVRGSWGSSFDAYARNNILATQCLLEGLKDFPLRKLVYASSSSIYGNAETFPTPEATTPHPISPYGVTKLAGEHLSLLYRREFGMPVNCVRFFTVYGPRQRPDMAFHRFIDAIDAGRPIEVYGDGEQTRDFTYVDDAVDGLIRAAATEAEGEVFNIGGGSRVSVNEVLRTLEGLMEREARVIRVERQGGDVRDTAADIRRARSIIGYNPRTSLAAGLRAEVEWCHAAGTGPRVHVGC